MRDRSRWRVPLIAAGVFVLATALRLVFLSEVHGPQDHIESDMGVYDRRARNLVRQQLGPWDTFTPVGYPLYVAIHYALGLGAKHVGTSQALLGGLTCLLAALIAARIENGARGPRFAALAAALTGIACAIYVPLIRYGALLLSEVPFAAGVACSTWLLLRLPAKPSAGRVIAAGTVLALATTIRPNLLLVFPLLPLWLWITLGRDLKKTVRVSLVLFAAAMPWFAAVAAHNTRLRGEPTGLATNGGLNFFMARSPVQIVIYQEGRFKHAIGPIPNMIRYYEEHVSPVPFYDEAWFYREGFEVARRDPSTWWRSFENLWEGTGLGRQSYWPPWPRNEGIFTWCRRSLAALALAPALAGFAWAAARGRLLARERAPHLLIYMMLATVAVTLYVWLGDPRVRVPFDPLIVALASSVWIGAGNRALQLIRAPRSTRADVAPRPETSANPGASGSLGS